MEFNQAGPLIVKLEDSPSPQPPIEPTLPQPQPSPTKPQGPSLSSATLSQIDPTDPEEFLRRCSGYNKNKGKRCAVLIGKNTARNGINYYPEYLPTCHSHKDQLSYAGHCQYVDCAGQRCDRLFRWTKPYFELCSEHMGHPNTPCYLFKLPIELRMEIWRYLMPNGPIGSSTALCHQVAPYAPPHSTVPAPSQPFATMPTIPIVASQIPPPSALPNPPLRSRSWRMKAQRVPSAPTALGPPWSVVSLMLVNHQLHAEAKDMLYGSIPFTIDIRKDGTFMCGRRLLEPKSAEGRPLSPASGTDSVQAKFLRTFDFESVKNYNINIVVENSNPNMHMMPNIGRPMTQSYWTWDEEVELYDIRDYVGVAVSGILSKSRKLCRLNVRVGVAGFNWSQEELIQNTRCIVEPFLRLRKVLQPRLCGVYDGITTTPPMLSIPNPANRNGVNELCSVPQLPTSTVLLGPGNACFDEYQKMWETQISQTTSPPPKSPVRAMFSELKVFYTQLIKVLPKVSRVSKHCFLHRARVAREKEDIEAFREVRNELIAYWGMYLDEEEQRREDMNRVMSKMLNADIYPSADDEDRNQPPSPQEDPGSPNYLAILECAEEAPGMNQAPHMRNQPLVAHQQVQQQMAQQIAQQQQMALRQQMALQQQASVQQPQPLAAQHLVQCQRLQQCQRLRQIQSQQMMQIPSSMWKPSDTPSNVASSSTGVNSSTDLDAGSSSSLLSSSSSSPGHQQPPSSQDNPQALARTSGLRSRHMTMNYTIPNMNIHQPVPDNRGAFTPLASPDCFTSGPTSLDSDVLVPQPQPQHPSYQQPSQLAGNMYTTNWYPSVIPAMQQIQQMQQTQQMQQVQSLKRKAEVVDLSYEDPDHVRSPLMKRRNDRLIGDAKGKSKAEYIEILDD
ncbi:hypothetical protein K432DRAFT_441223 [Lepidopterella palustris CBS 459.81]|uniref:Uncharacterized protein n=1 Tax=Lepidopterella palustris CBS 459.81 TaxID=1314670 RepID=A0A8E2JHK6_9PEZI|nr:hypothetical protein K432DRAFT_441223 [Lepidopterella palustris CBS 459.81]